MSLSKIMFNLMNYIPETGNTDYSIVPKKITIPKGTRTVMLLTNNSDGTYGDLHLHEANFCKQVTTDISAYYKEYRDYKIGKGSAGHATDGTYTKWDNAYVISAKVNDLWDNHFTSYRK